MQEFQKPLDNDTPNIDAATVEEGKTYAIISYITLIGLVAALILNNDKKNPYAKYHITQSLGIMATGLAVSFVSWVPFIGWLIGLLSFFFLTFLWIMGLVNAINGKAIPVPVLGKYYADWFQINLSKSIVLILRQICIVSTPSNDSVGHRR